MTPCSFPILKRPHLTLSPENYCYKVLPLIMEQSSILLALKTIQKALEGVEMVASQEILTQILQTYAPPPPPPLGVSFEHIT